MQFPLSQDDTIKAYGAPTNVLMDFRVLSKPCSVIRNVTLSLIDTLDDANQKSSKDTRLVLTGSAGCGKSFLMLQAVEYCSASNWMTLYVPRGRVGLAELGITTVDSSHYVHDPQTRTYLQPEYSYQLLRRFLSVNSRQLAELSTRKGFSVDDVLGLDDQRLAPAMLSRALEEVSQQNTFPVLMAVDEIQAVYRTSLYRDPHYWPVLSQCLSVPRLILEYACGSKFFTRGAFLGAVSTANTRFKMPIELSEALGLPLPRPAGPYYHRSSELEHYAGGLRNFPVPEQLNVGEAASLFEVWMADKALHSGEFCEASGNPRSFVWNGLMATMNSL
ncbi:mitochondrial ribosomal death-associated protein 3-domain-containing protein [Sparassis latifolia]